MPLFSIRTLMRADLPVVGIIVDATDMFPSDMLAPMAEPFLSGAEPHRWSVATDAGVVIGFTYCEPERMTEGTYNMLAIAVDPTRQNQGAGKALVAGLADDLRRAGARVLIVETSSLDAFESARRFYDGLGFTREARIRDFYAAGEDKIVFWKLL